MFFEKTKARRQWNSVLKVQEEKSAILEFYSQYKQKVKIKEFSDLAGWHVPIISTFVRLRQEDCMFMASPR